MTSYRMLKWRRPSEKMPEADDILAHLLIVVKGRNGHQDPQIGCYLGGNRWEYKNSSPSFTSKDVAYWAYIPEPPND